MASVLRTILLISSAKQWGLQALQSQADLSPCILDFQSRNLIPDIPDHFLCLWEHCEVSRQSQE